MNDTAQQKSLGASSQKKEKAKPSKVEKKTPPREIAGNFPYTTSHGVLKQILQKMIEAERPTKFSGDFLNTVLGFSGGSAAVVPPILKRTGFLSADATPTDQYNRFKSEGGRSQAAFDALKNGFGELFKRNEYAHKLSDDGLRDLLVTITGLNKNDPVIRAISGTFQTIKSFIEISKLSDSPKQSQPLAEVVDDESQDTNGGHNRQSSDQRIGLTYNINLVLPSTDDPNVLNAIFKSLKENLLR